MKLTKQEKRQHRSYLEQWRTPDEVFDHYDKLVAYMGDADLFSQGGVDFLMEAWGAAKFVSLQGGEMCRLIPAQERWPDFQTRIDGRVEKWEFTEVDVPDRRRGDEYRERRKNQAAGQLVVWDDPVEAWIARAEKAPAAIRQRCEAKAAKLYSGQAGLLIYLNIGEFGIRQHEIEVSFKDSTAVVKDVFSEIWILWKERLYCVWRGGFPEQKGKREQWRAIG